MTDIILTTLNDRFSHTSIALRYIYANLKELKEKATILEFVINENIQTIAEKILEQNPKIVGIGVYIWNAIDVSELVNVIKSVSPETIIILGGSEVSYFPIRVNFEQADFIIQGEGEEAFYTLCKDIFENRKPHEKIIKSKMVDLNSIELPYKYYSDFDIKNRCVYIESSRGCPFLCEFCLSSIDEKMRYINIEKFLHEIETLWQKGVRTFKFIDRTFNLNIKYANAILDYFLQKEPPYFLHFEVIPDTFPTSLREKLKLFPKSSLQLEVGIQTLNLDVANNINRKLNIEKIKENLSFLEQETNAHLHVDLIVGLPNEDIESFGKNLNLLYSLTKSEIQIGILKKLSGTTINRHDEPFKMVYSNKPPFDILQTDKITFKQMQQLKRFARFWDIVYNSGNFVNSTKLMFHDGLVFETFFEFSEFIYSKTDSTFQISLDRMSELIFNYLVSVKTFDKSKVATALIDDILKIAGRVLPKFLREYHEGFNKKERVELSGATKRQDKRG